MKKQDQIRIATEIADTFKEKILKQVENIPEDWDGIEIRQLGVEIMYRESVKGRQLIGERLKDFENELIVSNLG